MIIPSASAIAAEPSVGVIKGQLVNGTEGVSSVAGQEVILKTYLNDIEAGSVKAKTDAEGRFQFDGLATGPNYRYQVQSQYQEAEYTSEWLSFAENETSKSVEVAIYDSTFSDEAIRIMSSHAIIYVEGDGLLVKEYLLLVNVGDRTYVGSKAVTADGKKETLRFSLPREASGLELTRELMQCCVLMTEGGFIDTMPVLPGAKEVAYSYKIKPPSGAYTFSEIMYYPRANFDLLVQGEGIDGVSDQLTLGESLDINGKRFVHLSGKNLSPGTALAVNLSGLTTADNGSVLKWVILALVVLLCGSSYFLVMRRFQPVAAKVNLDQREQALLLEIAQLDDDFEEGRISEENYRRVRSERKAKLTKLMRGLEGGSGR